MKPKVCELLTIWLAQEVKNFSRSIFHSVHRERESVLSFHDKSIFKSTVNTCKYAAKKLEPGDVDQAELKMVVYCLRILNGQLAKSLPPFNWSFLNDFLLVSDELRKEVLKFWAKESVTSISAKTCIETWLKKIDFDSCDVSFGSESVKKIKRFLQGMDKCYFSTFYQSTRKICFEILILVPL